MSYDPAWDNASCDTDWDIASYDPDWNDASCHTEGVMGNCGEQCRVFMRGDCPIEDEVIEGTKERNKKENDPVENFDRAMDIFN